MRIRRRLGDGQALAEFALIAPILFLLLFGVIQIGLLFAGQNGLVNGVREATRRAATYRVNDASLSDAGIFTAVCTAVDNELNAQLSRQLPGFVPSRLHRVVSYHWEANPGVAPSVPVASGSPGPQNYFLYVQVQASYDHPLFVPLVGIFFDALDGTSDNAFTLTASEQMRIENPSMSLGSTPANCP